MRKKTAWLVVAGGAAALGGFVLQQGLTQAWKLSTGEEPPQDPDSWDVAWKDAIAWTLATGIIIGLGRLMARRGAAAGWKYVMGETPPF